MSDVTKASDLRERTDEELEGFLSEKQHELFKLRFQHFTGQLENTAKLRIVRREVARARTIMGERARGGTAVLAKPKPEAESSAPPAREDEATAETSTLDEDQGAES